MSFNPEYFFPTLITDITSLNGGGFGTVKASDVYPAVDVTDVSQSPNGTTKPYQIYQLANYILNSFGLNTYAAVLAATTNTNLTATYTSGLAAGQPGIGATLTNSGTQTAFMLDGQTGILNARYLIKDQSNSAQNGIYTLTNIGSASTNWVLTRSIDFNTSTTVSPPETSNIFNNGVVYVLYGAINGNIPWQDMYTGPMTVGTTDIGWTEFVIAPNGQFISQFKATTSSINLATTSVSNIASITLTPGNWNVFFQLGFIAANTTSLVLAYAGLSTSNTGLNVNNFGSSSWLGSWTGDGNSVLQLTGSMRVSVNTTTIYYANVLASFSVSTCVGYGGLWASQVI